MNCGIYKITNINGKVYIGSSIILDKRITQHKINLKGNYNKSPHLQLFYNKYGKNSFVFEILLYCDEENLAFYEQRAIDEYKSLDGDFGYNICPAARTDLIGSNYDKWIKNCSESKKGKKSSEETKQKISDNHADVSGKNNPNYGKHRSEETKKKISEKAKKRTGKLNSFYGKKHSEESKKKIAENRKYLRGKEHHNYGKKFSEETKKKMSEARKGKKLSKEHVLKMAEATRNRHHENRKIKLAPMVKYVEEQTGYLIYLKDRQDGRLVIGTIDMGDGVCHKVAYVYFKNYTEAVHELSHIWATPGPRPTGDKELLIRELEAWRCAECLHHKFGIKFDVDVFDKGLGSYVISLVVGMERPSYEWLSQLIGE